MNDNRVVETVSGIECSFYHHEDGSITVQAPVFTRPKPLTVKVWSQRSCVRPGRRWWGASIEENGLGIIMSTSKNPVLAVKSVLDQYKYEFGG